MLDRRTILITTINTVAFTLSFAVWVMLGPAARFVASDLGISETTAGLLKATPILLGAALRLPIGLLADRIGARATFPLVQLLGVLGALALSFSSSLAGLVVGGLVLGFVGTTFVVGVQNVSGWTPPAKQGFTLGVLGAGTVGTAITTLGMPFLLAPLGWRATFRLYALVLAVTAVAYFLAVRNAPAKGPTRTLRELLSPVKDARVLRFSLYYFATFGAFVAAALVMSDVYLDSYKLTPKVSGLLATTFTFSAAVVRAYGGKLADERGARPVLRWSLLVIAVALTPVAFAPPLAATVVLVFTAGIAMGIGSGATFKYIPQYYGQSVGAVSGVVGGLGGLGGFFLPMGAAWMKAQLGSATAGVAPLAALAAVAFVIQAIAIRRSVDGARPLSVAVAKVAERVSEHPSFRPPRMA